MRVLTSKITVGNYSFDKIVNCEIKSSCEILMDTCTLTILRDMSWKGEKINLGTSGLIQVGNVVKVELGYDKNLEVVFEGFVKTISTDSPVKIECEDAAFLLKTGTKVIAYETVTLEQLLKDILPNTVKFEAIKLSLGMFRMDSQATALEVLNKLKESYSLFSFFRAGKLYVGPSYWKSYQKIQKLNLQDNVVSNELSFKKATDTRTQIVVNSIGTTKKENIHYEVGDADGQVRNLEFHKIKSVDDLKIIAENELKRYKYDGLSGSIVCFGAPFLRHGDAAELTDKVYPERNGTYLIKSVDYSFNDKGYRQKIELTEKIKTALELQTAITAEQTDFSDTYEEPGAYFASDGKFIKWVGTKSETLPVYFPGIKLKLNINQFLNRVHWIYGETGGVFHIDLYAHAQENFKRKKKWTEEQLVQIINKGNPKPYWDGTKGNPHYKKFAEYREDLHTEKKLTLINDNKDALKVVLMIKDVPNSKPDPANGIWRHTPDPSNGADQWKHVEADIVEAAIKYQTKRTESSLFGLRAGMYVHSLKILEWRYETKKIDGKNVPVKVWPLLFFPDYDEPEKNPYTGDYKKIPQSQHLKNKK